MNSPLTDVSKLALGAHKGPRAIWARRVGTRQSMRFERHVDSGGQPPRDR